MWVLFDMGYTNFAVFRQFSEQGVTFLTRAKTGNTPFFWFFRTLMLLANLRRIDFAEKRGILEPVRTKHAGG